MFSRVAANRGPVSAHDRNFSDFTGQLATMLDSRKGLRAVIAFSGASRVSVISSTRETAVQPFSTGAKLGISLVLQCA